MVDWIASGLRLDKKKELEQKLSRLGNLISERAHKYFEDFSEDDVKVSVDRLRHLKNSLICDFVVEQNHHSRSIVVKTSPVGGLNNILKLRVGEDFLYEREFSVLRKTYDFLTEVSHSVHAVRPLDLLESPPSILTEKVDGVSYQKLFRRAGRLGSPASRELARRACELAGEWLLRFHQVGILPFDSRVERWSDPMGPFEQLLENLSQHVSDAELLENVKRKAQSRLQKKQLQPEVDFTVNHGDFALRNLMWLKKQSVAVFDTLALHVEPIYLDMAYFITSLRTYWLHVLTVGNFFSPSQIETYISAFVAAYRKEREIDPSILDFFVLYSLLDKWNTGFIHLKASGGGFFRIRRTIKQKAIEQLVRQEVFRDGA